MLGNKQFGEIILRIIREKNNDNLDVKLYMVEKLKNKRYYLHRPVLESEIGNTIAKDLLSNLNVINKNNIVVEFNPLLKQDDTIEHINTSGINGFSNILEDMQNSEMINFDMKELNTADLTFYMIDINHNGTNIKLVRRYTNAKTLKKRSYPLRFIDNSLTRLSEELFFIDELIDLVIIDNEHIIVLNRYSFEVIMNYKDNYIENLKKALKVLKASKFIENFDQFEQDCYEQILIAKKFTNILKNGNLRIIERNIAKVGQAINECGLPIKFKSSKIQYEDKSQLYIIVEILSDNFAKTLIGGQKVNVIGKNVV